MTNAALCPCQAKTWQQVNASNPFARCYHGAVMDVQQRMWIFGGNADDDGRGPTVKASCDLCVMQTLVGQPIIRYLCDCCDWIMRLAELE